MLTREDQSDLLGLSWNWEGAYTFQVTDGVWKAVAVDGSATVLIADSAAELREKIRDDYAQRRRLPAGPTLSERMST